GRARLSADLSAAGRAHQGRVLAAVRASPARSVRRADAGARARPPDDGSEVEGSARAGVRGTAARAVGDDDQGCRGAHSGRVERRHGEQPRYQFRALPHRRRRSGTPADAARRQAGGGARRGVRSGTPALHAGARGRGSTACPEERPPRLGEHDQSPLPPRDDRPTPPARSDSAPDLPLEGVTVLEFGMMFAGPFASAMLADLGARVIKVESLEGDQVRRLLAFPEAGGARVMQGKESITLDLSSEKGRRIVHQLAERADIVLQAFRAGAAARAGVDQDTLKAVNPDLVYVNAPGYGTGGPFGHRAAYAPTIAAASGLSLTDVADIADLGTAEIEELRAAGIRVFASGTVAVVQADGISALGVASAMLLGLVAKARKRPLGPLTTT